MPWRSPRSSLGYASSSASAPGSRLAVDLVNGGFFRFPYTRDYLEALVAAGIPWRFGTDTPEQLLTDCGWRVDSIDEPGSENASYGRRWPYPRSTTASPTYRAALAHRHASLPQTLSVWFAGSGRPRGMLLDHPLDLLSLCLVTSTSSLR